MKTPYPTDKWLIDGKNFFGYNCHTDKQKLLNPSVRLTTLGGVTL